MYKIIAICEGIFVVVATCFALLIYHHNTSLREELTKVKQDNVTLVNSNIALERSLETQNAAIKKASETAASLQKALDEKKTVVKEVVKTVTTYKDRVFASPMLDTCDKAMQYIFDTRKELSNGEFSEGKNP